MDKELFEFLMQETNFTKEQLEAVYYMNKQGKEIADKINSIYKNKPESVCKLAFDNCCSKCPIKRVKDNLDEDISLFCNDIYIILQLLKEENK